MSSDDETFEQVGSGATDTVPAQAGNLKKGDFVCIKGFPCKIVDISTSKTGKHGHAKANITAIDIFTGKKYEEVAPTSHTLPIPVVVRAEYTVADVAHDGRLSLMDGDSNIREDLDLPAEEELASQIKEAFASGKEITVIVQKAMGKEQVVQIK
jgi:translation initiation factor 5A